MNRKPRRAFLEDVGRGMLIASVGPALANDLGISSAFSAEESTTLSFGKLEPLVSRMQETPVEKLQPFLVDKLKTGAVDLRHLVTAAALANARQFGGEDYVGFHVMMALMPAYQMAHELPAAHQPLPVLKVLFRNTEQIQKSGGRVDEVLEPVEAAGLPESSEGAELLRTATRRPDLAEAERIFAALSHGPVEKIYNQLQYPVQDDADVHRVVLAHCAWALLDLLGADHAHTLLRQSVRYCVQAEELRISKGRPAPSIRTVLPKLLDEYHLVGRPPGSHQPDDAWVDQLCRTMCSSNKEQAAEAAAAALAEGMSPEAVGEAISLAANQVVLRDRSPRAHGATTGVHGSDSANAWRNIARVTNSRNTFASLIVGAYHVAFAGQFPRDAYPLASHRETVKANDPESLLRAAEEAIQANDQGLASAAILRYGEFSHPARPVFGLMLRYAISEDGRLHGEKYYRTVVEESATTRPAFRWRHLVALARVTASAYGYDMKDQQGYRAPGYEEACRLLGV